VNRKRHTTVEEQETSHARVQFLMCAGIFLLILKDGNRKPRGDSFSEENQRQDDSACSPEPKKNQR
jgi:hypothetical protein